MIRKRKVKIISIITLLFVIVSLISLKSLNAKANNIASKPSFTITDLKATPNPVKVGEDILVSGKLVPEDFETIAQAKEIVLVLDTSGSMSGNKIKNLKEAAKSFVEKMKDVPNLKIGIIKYASDATIVSNLIAANDSSLITTINKLSANGGTNTREGLRKAAYLLNNDSESVNKTIVLMTDGNPTYYSKYDKLDDSTPTRYGSGSSTNSTTMNYTKNFAKDHIAAKQYNAYSIGYGLDNNGTKYLKQIHQSMRNISENTDINEKNGFFSKSDGSITEIFNEIADDIKNSYELKEVSLNIDLNQSFNLNIGEMKLKLEI
ncbi:VWA domain-containing protein [Clostridium sartagoforme]|uniref:VWA domain-containing protein n=1 Tax=Clostridium sartagoforme TaxID=84031 RepID=UPI0003A33C5A|nr:VWA domain-containing protein [Clostridium sartagoforme]